MGGGFQLATVLDHATGEQLRRLVFGGDPTLEDVVGAGLSADPTGRFVLVPTYGSGGERTRAFVVDLARRPIQLPILRPGRPR